MKILEPRVVEEGFFVWGSNEVGRSFSGAANTAVEKYGAKMGISFGFTGQSFAIPTKDANLKPLPLPFIKNYVDQFIKETKLKYLLNTPRYISVFMVSRIGCGLAGYKDEEIAPLFEAAGSNIYFDLAWKPYLGGIASDLEPRLYWGTFSDLPEV